MFQAQWVFHLRGLFKSGFVHAAWVGMTVKIALYRSAKVHTSDLFWAGSGKSMKPSVVCFYHLWFKLQWVTNPEMTDLLFHHLPWSVWTLNSDWPKEENLIWVTLETTRSQTPHWINSLKKVRHICTIHFSLLTAGQKHFFSESMKDIFHVVKQYLKSTKLNSVSLTCWGFNDVKDKRFDTEDKTLTANSR